MALPFVSVIVAVRNGERYLAAALNSILAQTYQSFEIIVVDGHSTDATALIARAHAGIRLVEQAGLGIAAAYNTGIQVAQGDLVAFLSHDDLWTPHKLSLQVGYMVEHPGIQYTNGLLRFFLEPDCRAIPGFRRGLLEGTHPGWIMETLVVRKALFARLGGFDEHLTLAEDIDWYARARDHGIPSALLAEVVLHKRVHDANATADVASSNRGLLSAMKRSIDRKKGSGPTGYALTTQPQAPLSPPTGV